MFRFASCNDLIKLKSKFPKLILEGVNGWGLKQLGYLFVYDYISGHDGDKVLEIGAGLSTFFDEFVGNVKNYHLIDKPGFYDAQKFEATMKKRTQTTFFPLLLGEYSDKLKEESFDFVFSVSVLEHVSNEQIYDVCMDMYRILKPGGHIIHTIDIFCEERTQTVGMQYYQALKKCGFADIGLPELEWDLTSGNTILFEPLEIVYKYYMNMKVDMWSVPGYVPGHAASIMVHATKR